MCLQSCPDCAPLSHVLCTVSHITARLVLGDLSRLMVFVSVWAEISSRRPSGPVTLTGGASPSSTTTTCSPAASWWSCSPSSSTCCGFGASTGGRAVGPPPPSGWRRAFPPRRLREPYEREQELEAQEDLLKEKPFLPQGFVSILVLFFPSLFGP